MTRLPDQPDQISCLESIGRLLAENVPDSWLWIRCTGDLDETGIGLESFYQPTDQQKEPEPFVIENEAIDYELALCFQKLADVLAGVEKKRFRKCHFQLRNDGKYRADYEY